MPGATATRLTQIAHNIPRPCPGGRQPGLFRVPPLTRLFPTALSTTWPALAHPLGVAIKATDSEKILPRFGVAQLQVTVRLMARSRH